VIEAYVLRALRDLRLSMDEIRGAAELVREEFNDPYALAHRRIVTDGVALFVRMTDSRTSTLPTVRSPSRTCRKSS
jgi:hypothetical protein